MHRYRKKKNDENCKLFVTLKLILNSLGYYVTLQQISSNDLVSDCVITNSYER